MQSVNSVLEAAALLIGALNHIRGITAQEGTRDHDVDLPSPKLGTGDRVDTWYRFYAGYSSQFVEYALNNAAPNARNVLDPWNGTGTTTVVAAGRSIASYGFDINPAAVIVARARLLDDSVDESIEALTNNITSRAHPERIRDDPLSFWFAPDSAAQLRALQIGIHRLLVDSSDADANPTFGVNAAQQPRRVLLRCIV